MPHGDSNSSSDSNNIQLKILDPKPDSADGTTTFGTGPSNSCEKKCNDTDELAGLISTLEELLDKSSSNSKKDHSSNSKKDPTFNKSNCDDINELSNLMATLEELTSLIDTTNPSNDNPTNATNPTNPTNPTSNPVNPTSNSTNPTKPTPVNIDAERENLSTSVATAKIAIDRALESIKNLECNSTVFVEVARMYVQETYKTANEFINLLEKQGYSNTVISDIINKLKWGPVVKLFGLEKLVNNLDNELNKSQNNFIKFLSIINSDKN